MKRHLVLIVGATVLAICFVGFLLYSRTRVWSPPSNDDCGRPPGPFYSNDANVDIAIQNTVAVFKGRAEPRVIDVIPAEARSIEMIGYLTCKAQKSGLLTNNDHLREYTLLLSDVVQGKQIKRYVRHFGPLSFLQKHLSKNPDNDFILTLDSGTPSLKDFYIEEISAQTWPKWVEKMCATYGQCLECDRNGEDAAQIHVRAGTGLQEIKIDGVTYYRCKDSP